MFNKISSSYNKVSRLLQNSGKIALHTIEIGKWKLAEIEEEEEVLTSPQWSLRHRRDWKCEGNRVSCRRPAQGEEFHQRSDKKRRLNR